MALSLEITEILYITVFANISISYLHSSLAKVCFLLELPSGHMLLNALVKYQETIYLVIHPPNDEVKLLHISDPVIYIVLQFSVIR